MPINIRVKYRLFYIYLGTILFIGAGCSPLRNSNYEEYLSLKYELAECSTTYTYTTTTTLSGTAKFYKRGVNLVTQYEIENSESVLKLKNMTQGDPLVDPLPIKFAEVAVYNSSNKIVQCGKTDANGNLKALNATSDLLIPKIAGNYTVRVFARMNHALSKVTANAVIKKDKYTNEVYFISSNTASNGVDDSNVNLLAYARQTDAIEVEGGPFNILNSIYASYQYINSNTGAVGVSCLNTKVNVYWKLGFNPAQYYYPEMDPSELPSSTFYKPEINALFISGGKLGNFSFEPAAHFDDYEIIHELGHHIENVCGSLVSPGGSHYAITRVDPRLAWAEGWSNYFAAQVMYNSIGNADASINIINPEFKNKMIAAGISATSWTYFFASVGFSDSVQNIGSGTGFMFDIKRAGSLPDLWQTGPYLGQPFDKVDPTRYPGEGHFREGAITRGLFKLSNVCGGTCITAAPIAFESMWKSMNKLTGIGQSSYTFKSSADFMERLKAQVTWDAAKIAFNQAATSEALHLFSDGAYTSAGVNKWVPYGTYLTTATGGACTIGTFHIEPRFDDPVLTGANSDQRYSNHFYTIDFSLLTGLDEIQVVFGSAPLAGGTATEFDILLFQQDYEFNGDYVCPTFNSDGSCKVSYQASRGTNSTVVKSDRRSGLLTTKVIRDLQKLDRTKRYLLNIRAYTANISTSPLTEYTYAIKNQTGANLCP